MADKFQSYLHLIIDPASGLYQDPGTSIFLRTTFEALEQRVGGAVTADEFEEHFFNGKLEERLFSLILSPEEQQDPQQAVALFTGRLANFVQKNAPTFEKKLNEYKAENPNAPIFLDVNTLQDVLTVEGYNSEGAAHGINKFAPTSDLGAPASAVGGYTTGSVVGRAAGRIPGVGALPAAAAVYSPDAVGYGVNNQKIFQQIDQELTPALERLTQRSQQFSQQIQDPQLSQQLQSSFQHVNQASLSMADKIRQDTYNNLSYRSMEGANGNTQVRRIEDQAPGIGNTNASLIGSLFFQGQGQLNRGHENRNFGEDLGISAAGLAENLGMGATPVLLQSGVGALRHATGRAVPSSTPLYLRAGQGLRNAARAAPLVNAGIDLTLNTSRALNSQEYAALRDAGYSGVSSFTGAYGHQTGRELTHNAQRMFNNAEQGNFGDSLLQTGQQVANMWTGSNPTTTAYSLPGFIFGGGTRVLRDATELTTGADQYRGSRGKAWDTAEDYLSFNAFGEELQARTDVPIMREANRNQTNQEWQQSDAEKRGMMLYRYLSEVDSAGGIKEYRAALRRGERTEGLQEIVAKSTPSDWEKAFELVERDGHSVAEFQRMQQRFVSPIHYDKEFFDANHRGVARAARMLEQYGSFEQASKMPSFNHVWSSVKEDPKWESFLRENPQVAETVMSAGAPLPSQALVAGQSAIQEKRYEEQRAQYEQEMAQHEERVQQATTDAQPYMHEYDRETMNEILQGQNFLPAVLNRPLEQQGQTAFQFHQNQEREQSLNENPAVQEGQTTPAENTTPSTETAPPPQSKDLNPAEKVLADKPIENTGKGMDWGTIGTGAAIGGGLGIIASQLFSGDDDEDEEEDSGGGIGAALGMGLVGAGIGAGASALWGSQKAKTAV